MGLLHHPVWLQLIFGTFGTSFYNFWNYSLFWLRVTDEVSVPEMRILSILLIKSDLKWCLHLSRSLFLYFNYLVSVTAGGPESPRGHMWPSSTVDFGWFVVFWEHQIFPYRNWLKLYFCGFTTPSLLPSDCFWHFWDIILQLLKLLPFWLT